MTQASDKMRDELLDAALPNVAFDGWSEATWRAAVARADVDPALARALFPRGALDLALAFHRRGNDRMREQLGEEDLAQMRFRDRVARAVRLRLELAEPDKEAVRRAMTLFSLPQNAADGSRALWETAGASWVARGDSSTDLNYYSKRATLSAVHGATLLYWLGDDSIEHNATWDFLDRRIDDVMQFEKLKAALGDNPLLRPFMAGPNWLARQFRAPASDRLGRMPGSLGRRR